MAINAEDMSWAYNVLSNGLIYKRFDLLVRPTTITFNGITIKFSNWKDLFSRVMGILLVTDGASAREAMVKSKINDSIGFFSTLDEALIFNQSSNGNRVRRLKNDFFLACNLNSGRTYEHMVLILKSLGYEEDAIQFNY